MDILLDLFPYMKGQLRESGQERQAPTFNLSPDERALYDIITLEPAHVDALSAQAGVPVQKALSLLLGMELKGAVRQLSGMMYVREY